MKIVILDGFMLGQGELSFDPIASLGECTYYDQTDYSNEDEIVERIGDAEAIFVNKVPMTESVMARCPQLKFIGETATGYNNIDLVAAAKHDIVVTNVPTYGTDTVAQFAMALLLEICNGVGHHAREVAKGRWCQSKFNCFWDFPGIELAGKTVGIIGCGRIGMAFARMAQGMGMKVMASHPRKVGQSFAYGEYVDLSTLLQQSDVISLHCPLTEETAEIINQDTIAQMKAGVILLNTSRGQLVNEQALADALASGKVGAAGLDVVSVEPILETNPLLQAPNCTLTPHMAWSATEARERLLQVSGDNLKGFLEGQIINQVK